MPYQLQVMREQTAKMALLEETVRNLAQKDAKKEQVEEGMHSCQGYRQS
jgi:hypothetical protein